ncbi:MAG: DNA topoisomerase IV subunit A, partial [Candidatus Accumulibacter sp.]|uniref:DNA gyrase subunit A n=1 Tax=Accumulibacter sp. TaxID=2053492 RepID=UPI001B2AD47A
TGYRGTEYRRHRADERITSLEGRHIVFLNIDEVIRIIRESDDPKAALIARFILSDRQAEDILEIRLRQLARLEGIRIEQELAKLRGEREGLLKLLGSDALLRRQAIREIKADAEKHGDARRTVIETAVTASRAEAAAVADEPVTVVISEKGWARVRQGHGLDLSGVVFKDGDRAGSAQECRSVDSLVIVSTEGRAFTVAVASLPDGRGMGAPLSSFVELGSGRIAHVITGRADDQLLVAKTSGYGFICKYGDLLSRQRAGKAFLTVEDGASILPLLRIGSQDHLAALADDGRLLIFPLAQMKRLAGGKGVQIIALQGRETLRTVVLTQGVRVTIRGTARSRTKTLVSEDRHLGQRARRGSPVGQMSNVTLEAYPE